MSMKNRLVDAKGFPRPGLLLLISLLLLRSRLLTGPRAALRSLTAATLKQKVSEEDLTRALQQVYTKDADGTTRLLVPHEGRIKQIPIRSTTESVIAANARRFRPISASHKPGLDKSFLRQLLAILRVAFPTYHSKEAIILFAHTFFLVFRTVLSVAVARLDGRIVRDLVSADGKGFLKGLGLWFALAVPSTYTNVMIRHLQAKLSLGLRTRLTRYTDDVYLSSSPDLRYYRTALEGGLDDVDQYITSDIAAFCDSLTGIYGNVLKPSLDLILFTSQLSRTLGFRGTFLLGLNYYVTARILRAATPAFGRLAAVEAQLEGEYRAGMGRVDRESEEIAFYGGGLRERSILWRAYLRLIRHVNSIYKIRIAYEWTEDFVIKYLWSAAGYCLISIPVFLTRRRHVGVQAGVPTVSRPNDEVANRTETYISSRRLLLSLADAGGRVMYAYKDLLELAGLTTRLYSLLSTLHNLPPLPPTSDAAHQDFIELTNVDVGVPTVSPAVIAGVPEKTGSSWILVKDLSLVLHQGEHLMITGSNGVGKTAVARVLAGLWAAQNDGEVKRPAGKQGVFIVPQRAYMVTGSLLDQIIYPHSYAEYLESGKTEQDLMDILAAANLAYLPAREGGWFTRKEWRDVLSGGEKQRMGLARVFYHMPKFAVLDECTSAVSSDVEGRMYEHAKSLGITLITISLRPSLMRYHTHLLTLAGDGTGKWQLTRIGTAEERMGIDREVITLEGKIAEVEKWEARVKELNQMLSAQEQ
ncbi:ABC transporter transmembrane region 2-domain-containing protein [Fomitopsis serialis]|uniref:ABC transporter transmembrane region 2-domain-containing protein n=1 Tax=Fomitopsis serialis TaxID=139415 RepID=UPI0020078DFF|nr:ABC transporter transmembrane region 2-domain-containing protein [Neoantrodia serialis]KAH9926703.1 ABC transporter transmembrane region 2-domain-containing protein [Neoantrodia serialis]